MTLIKFCQIVGSASPKERKLEKSLDCELTAKGDLAQPAREIMLFIGKPKGRSKMQQPATKATNLKHYRKAPKVEA